MNITCVWVIGFSCILVGSLGLYTTKDVYPLYLISVAILTIGIGIIAAIVTEHTKDGKDQD